LLTDEQIGSSLNADEITLRDLNIEMDGSTYNTAGTAIHMCPRDSTFQNLKIWGDCVDEAIIFETFGATTTTRVIGNHLSNIWLGRHFSPASQTGGLYFKPTGTNGAAETHIFDLYCINNDNYGVKFEYGATYDIKTMHITGFGANGTNGVEVTGVYDLTWSGGCVETTKRYGTIFNGGSHQCEVQNVIYFNNGCETDDTYSDIYISSAVGIKINNCKFRLYPGHPTGFQPKYNIEIVGAGDDACKGLQNYYDSDYAATASTVDGSGSFVDTESESYVS